MSVADKRKNGEQKMPVQALPMPPVKVQLPDNSGNSAFFNQKKNEAQPVPHLAALRLKL